VRLTGLIVALLLMAIAVETRHAVAGRLRSRSDVPEALPHLRNALAVSWPYLAILLIAFGWLAWAAIHLTALTGFLNRFSALAHWLRRLVSNGRSELAYSARFRQAGPGRAKTS